MRYVLQGALAAGLAYPLLWHYLAPDAPQIVSAAPPAVGAQAGHDPRSSVPSGNPQGAGARSGVTAGVPSLRFEADDAREGGPVRRVERLPAASVGSPALGVVAEPSVPVVTEPRVALPSDPQAPLPLPPGLPQLMSRMQDVQHSASDPTELAKRVQTLDADPTELAQLKAFADKFVQLPPSAADRYTGSYDGSGTSRHR